MANSAEPSSSLSFSSLSQVSNGSTDRNISTSPVSDTGPTLDMISLSKLSSNLEQLLADGGSDFSDADIIVEGESVSVHRCILAARSKFFHELFQRDKGTRDKDGKPQYNMSNLLPYGRVGYDAFVTFLNYLYTGKLKPYPTDVSTCVDSVCDHYTCSPTIEFAVELMYASAIFHVPELMSLFQCRLLNFVGKATVEDVIRILMAAFHCQLSQLLIECIDRVVRSDFDNLSLDKELPSEVVENIRSLRRKFHPAEENNGADTDALHEKRIRRIHKALDSDDVELLRLLLNESGITLDEACALHYAAAYCDPKVFSEVLGLDLADVNIRNSRGYTVLHIAAMRKEPSVIMALLTKGARVSETTIDGLTAVSLCRRMTRPKDYHAKVQQGQKTNKDRMCIDILEREMLGNPSVADGPFSSSMTVDNWHMKLLYLENRVALARLLFPSEAKAAMEIAHADTTPEFAGLSSFKGSSSNLREVDLNETPITRGKRLHPRIEALSKTVDTGRRYFPHCSEVLDKLMDDDLSDLCDIEKGTPEDQGTKRMRFRELKDEVQRAFNKDQALKDQTERKFSSSSLSSKRVNGNHKTRRV